MAQLLNSMHVGSGHPAQSVAKPESGARSLPVAERLGAMVESASTAAEAQFALFRLAIVKIVMATVLAIPMLLALAALGVYGFILLDRAADVALSRPDMAAWISPAVRGGVYFLLMASVLFPALKSSLTENHAAE